MTDIETLTLGENEVKVIRSRRRTLSLEVGHDGVKARAPMRMAKKTITEFLLTKQRWIERHLAELPERAPPPIFAHGVEILFQGSPIKVAIENGSRAPVSRTETEIRIPVAQSHLAIEQSAQRKLVTWLKKQALAELEGKVVIYAARMNVPGNKALSIKVRDYKRRWGSCDRLGSLSFNWRIVLAPEAVLDYVLVHELAHCHEFNHSKRFWSIVEHAMPNWKEQQDWLHTHGQMLYQLWSPN